MIFQKRTCMEEREEKGMANFFVLLNLDARAHTIRRTFENEKFVDAKLSNALLTTWRVPPPPVMFNWLAVSKYQLVSRLLCNLLATALVRRCRIHHTNLISLHLFRYFKK